MSDSDNDWLFIEAPATMPFGYAGPVDLVDRWDVEHTVAYRGKVWTHGEWVDASKFIHKRGSGMYPRIAINYAIPGAGEMYEDAAIRPTEANTPPSEPW